MAESSPLKATPKRKRDDVLNEQRVFNSSPNTYSLPKTTFSFQAPTLKPVEIPRNDAPEDGNSSPRSKVAQKFQELALGSGGGVIDNDRVDGNDFMGTRTGTGLDEASPNLQLIARGFRQSSPSSILMEVSEVARLSKTCRLTMTRLHRVSVSSCLTSPNSEILLR